MCSRMTKTPGTTQTPIWEAQVKPQTPEHTPKQLLSATHALYIKSLILLSTFTATVGSFCKWEDEGDTLH